METTFIAAPGGAPDPALPSLAAARALAEQLVQAAQAEYDLWDEADVDTYGGGGICHLIAERLVQVLGCAGIEAASVDSCHEQHTFVACRLAEGVVTLDLPHRLYEIGAAYHWTKIAGVVFEPGCLVWDCIDPNPAAYARYVDDFASGEVTE
jgi:hypothetical protein